MNKPLLEVCGIRKQFPGVVALDNVALTLYQGETLAVIGENGAGKSTLMKILGGVYQPDTGVIRIEDCPVIIDSVKTAISLGIALIHQELNLSDNLDIAANVFLGREPTRFGFLRLLKHGVLCCETQKLLERLGMDCSPGMIVKDLPIGQQQIVEIAKALSVNARILIMDEPTSSLSITETEQLFRVIRDLRNEGVSIIYISHRLGEVREIADRVVVLRDGKNSGELNRDEITRDRMIKLMVGRDIVQFYHHRKHAAEKSCFEVRNVRFSKKDSSPVSFSIGEGEIVGLAGLVGAGRTELAHTLFGITPPTEGEIFVNGVPVNIQSPRDAIRAGIALVPEDRKLQGLILEWAVKENIVLPGLDHFQRYGIVKNTDVQDTAKEMVDMLNIRTPTLEQEVQFLSGGNQQKVVLAKWLSLKPKALLLDEPTRGIDVVAKEEIYRFMEHLAAAGVGILMISSELQEILGIADRILVMHEGSLTGELCGNDFTEESVMHFATGGC